MTTTKIAISLQESLFEQADILSRELDISRSRLFALAVEEFIQRYQNRKLLKEINAAYDDLPDAEEQELRRQTCHQHRKIAEGKW